MTGLMAGSGVAMRDPDQCTIVYAQMILLVLLMLLPALTAYISRHVSISPWMSQGSLLIITAVIAYVTGLEFNMACRLEQRNIEHIAGSLYSFDLAGAACGTLMVSLIFFPRFGLQNTCFIIAALILASLVVMFFSVKRYGR
jgi:predicted membrane-bound spermidine synthase